MTASAPARRDYVSDFRIVRTTDFSSTAPGGQVTTGEYLVHAYSILSTNEVVFDVYEPHTHDEGSGSSHSTSMSFDEYGRLGSVRTRRIPSDVAALPYGDERTARCHRWFASNEALCHEVIRAAYPALFAHTGSGRLKDGHGACTTDEFRKEATV